MTTNKLLIKESDPEAQAAKFARQALEALKVKKPKKAALSIRLDADVLEFLKHMNDGSYQTRVNTILRSFIERPIDKLDAALVKHAALEVAKQQISIRLDEDVLAWFKSDGERYQTRINKVLRAFMMYSTTT